MRIIQRKWKPGEADEWRKEDWIAIIISPVAYILLMIGTVLSILFITWGFIILTVGIIITILMHWVIDPKLKVISEEYEKKQNRYLEELEKNVRWEKIKNG